MPGNLFPGGSQSIDQRVSEFFPQYYTEELNPQAKEITIRYLLKMSAGYDISNNKEIGYSEQIIKRTIQRSLENEPGEKFKYDNLSSNLLKEILEEATGQEILDFAQQHLFQPLGIEDVRWSKYSNGQYIGSSGLHLTPRQMAKFGLLFLNNGRWEGKQVVPAD